jgi:hypothetical protein
MHIGALYGILKMVGITEGERLGLAVEDSKKKIKRSRRRF